MADASVVSDVASVATALGAIFIGWQVVEARRQLRASFERTFVDRYEEILSRVPLALILGESDAVDERAPVTLMTLHNAKGLEFPVVFLVGVEDGLLPLRFGGAAPSGDDVAEERRLFFVGLTRAQDRLYISHARRRFDRDAAPSPFLAAIDPGLLERRGEDGPRRPRDRQLRLL